MDGDALPNQIAVADLCIAEAVGKIKILRFTADHGVLGDTVVRSDSAVAFDHHMGAYLRFRTDFDVAFDYRKGAYTDFVTQFYRFVDQCRGMNQRGATSRQNALPR
jgi:hypothetical protein